MSKRITTSQIETARTAFRNGKSIPECCSIANMSRASFNKYLGKEVQTWFDEAKAQRDRIAEIVPQPVNFEVLTPPISKLSIDEFESYIEFEFSQCSDFIELKDLFYELRNDESLTYEQVIKLREIYDNLKSESSDKSIIEIKSSKQTQQTIKAFKSKYNIKIPVPRLSTLQAEEWNKLERVYEHLAFWYVAHHEGRAAATAFIKKQTLETYKQWFDSVNT